MVKTIAGGERNLKAGEKNGNHYHSFVGGGERERGTRERVHF